MKSHEVMLGALLIAGLTSACGRKVEPAPRPPRAAAAIAEKAQDPAVVPARSPLAERLVLEGTAHNGSRQRVEQAMALLPELAIRVVRTRQVLAEPLGAEYCANGLSEAGLGFSLCAFADASAAERGRQRSRSTFERLIPGRDFVLSDRTLLTVLPTQGEIASQEKVRLLSRFAALCAGRLAAL